MFKKVLIANRGEIAVRIIRTCRELGIETVALYERADRGSLHVRFADQCVLLTTGFGDGAAVLEIARSVGADAIHPGYGFLAEDAEFVRSCEAAGIAFIGAPSDVLAQLTDKVGAINRVREAGFTTVEASEPCIGDQDFGAVSAAAEALGYPIVVKACRAGRGPGERLVRDASHLQAAISSAQAESRTVFGQESVYLERAILPVHQVGVQIISDGQGGMVHLGDREGSLQFNNRKLIEETPAPCLSPAQRTELCEQALAIARLFNYKGVGTVEFLIDGQGKAYFSEIKSRIQTEHPLAEAVSRIDLVREQIRIATGQPLGYGQGDIHLTGSAFMCRVNAEDPLHRLLPSPGVLHSIRIPDGAEIRIDTYVQDGTEIPAAYSPLIAKVTVWGATRAQALERMKRALLEFAIEGLPTNVPFIQSALVTSEVTQGTYDTETLYHRFEPQALPDTYFRDVAAIAALAFAQRHLVSAVVTPERAQSGWHRSSRRLPE